METCQLLGEKIIPGAKAILQFHFQGLSLRAPWSWVYITTPTNATIPYRQLTVY